MTPECVCQSCACDPCDCAAVCACGCGENCACDKPAQVEAAPVAV